MRLGARRSSRGWHAAPALALACLVGCAQTTEAATQVVFRIDSDLRAGVELTKVTVEVLRADGSSDGASQFPDLLIAEDGTDASPDGKKTLPLSGSVTQGSERKVMLHVVGWGALRPGDPVRALVEQRASVTFQRGKTQLVRVFLGEVCIDKDCDSALGLVCYPTALANVAGVAAGECGPIAAISDANTKLGVSPDALPELVSVASDAGVPVDAGDVVDDCAGNTCQNGSTCIDGTDTYTCDCGSSGYTGLHCETFVDECVGNACENSSACVAGADGAYICDCASTGYTGMHCETNVDDCGGNACEHGARCVDGINGYTCACGNTGYTGLRCATFVDACVGHTCQNGSSCVGTASGYACDCGTTGFSGPRCETKTDVDECASSNLCTSTDYPCVQTALPGYTCQGQFADWPMPEALPGRSPQPSYDVTSTPGVVVDRVTGLIWQRALPATYLGCTGQSTTTGQGQVGTACTWSEAKRYCAALGLAQLSGWRLPSKIELESIVDETRFNPAIDAMAFIDAPPQFFWSASPYVGAPGFAWGVSFYNGITGDNAVGAAVAVRCVR